MLGIRKAGEALRKFDDKYADALYVDNGTELFQMGHVMSLGDIARQSPFPGNKAANAALTAANFASRYALPAGAVTLAGKGLYDITQMIMPQQTSESVMPQ